MMEQYAVMSGVLVQNGRGVVHAKIPDTPQPSKLIFSFFIPKKVENSAKLYCRSFFQIIFLFFVRFVSLLQ